jgi:hypothetical protein
MSRQCTVAQVFGGASLILSRFPAWKCCIGVSVCPSPSSASSLDLGAGLIALSAASHKSMLPCTKCGPASEALSSLVHGNPRPPPPVPPFDGLVLPRAPNSPQQNQIIRQNRDFSKGYGDFKQKAILSQLMRKMALRRHFPLLRSGSIPTPVSPCPPPEMSDGRWLLRRPNGPDSAGFRDCE